MNLILLSRAIVSYQLYFKFLPIFMTLINFFLIQWLASVTIFYVHASLAAKSEKKGRYYFRLKRALPSVSDDHFQELGPDGTYRSVNLIIKFKYTNSELGNIKLVE